MGLITPLIRSLARAIFLRLGKRFSKSAILNLLEKYSKPSTLLKEVGIEVPGWLAYILDLQPIDDLVDKIIQEVGSKVPNAGIPTIVEPKKPQPKDIKEEKEPRKEKQKIICYQDLFLIIENLNWTLWGTPRYETGILGEPIVINQFIFIDPENIGEQFAWLEFTQFLIGEMNALPGSYQLPINLFVDEIANMFIVDVVDNPHEQWFFPEDYVIPHPLP